MDSGAASKSVTVLCATKGRPFLEHTVKSWTIQAGERDRMIVLGDGFDPSMEGVGGTVEFVECEKVGKYGHRHLWDRLMAGVSGDFITLIGDDDLFIPGVLGHIRPMLSKGVPVAYTLVDGRDGKVMDADPRWMVGAKRVMLPNHDPPWDDFDGFGSDGTFFKNEIQAFGGFDFHREPVQVWRAPLASRAVWHDLGLHRITEWGPHLEGMRT